MVGAIKPMSKKIVKCRVCGSEYEMPDICQEVIMEDCPNCKEMKKLFKELDKEYAVFF